MKKGYIDKDEVLAEVRRFAEKAHNGQMRKYSDDPYIVHPIRVMQLCKEYTEELPVLCAALLHDVLEDTPVQGYELKDFLEQIMNKMDADKTYRLVVELTDVYVKADYPQMNRRKRKAKEAERMKDTSSESQTVKYADIIDNCESIVKQDADFAKVFLNECNDLLRVMDKGNSEMYKRAVETIEKGMNELNLIRKRNIKSRETH